MEARFTWDRVKARRNQRVHGISFEVAADADVIHLVSARKAVDYEESIYNDQFR